jgi:hypothetical protein
MIMGNQKRFLDLFKDVAGRLTWRLLGFYDKDDLLPFEETQARYSAGFVTGTAGKAHGPAVERGHAAHLLCPASVPR